MRGRTEGEGGRQTQEPVTEEDVEEGDDDGETEERGDESRGTEDSLEARATVPPWRVPTGRRRTLQQRD